MSAPETLTEQAEEIARQIAGEITARRNGLLRDEDQRRERGPHTGYAFTATQRKQEEWLINGMMIALTYVLGRPNDLRLVEAFITDSPEWRALL
jgi:hypothetical protein